MSKIFSPPRAEQKVKVLRGLCRSRHPLLRVEEFNSHGAVVSCLVCTDAFQIREETLEDHYLHCPHISPDGPGRDRDFFILNELIED